MPYLKLRKKSKVLRERLLKKYKGIRFFDSDENETYAVVDVEYSKMVRPAQHSVLCTPCGAQDGEPEYYLINEVLHEMIRETEQDGVQLVEEATAAAEVES